jgi:hypothetical protein
MSKHKSSSGDFSKDRCKYLDNIPENQRTRLNGRIVRKGMIGGNAHREVIIIEDGKTIYHKFQ